MRGGCGLRDFLELVRSARDEDQVRACLDHDGEGGGEGWQSSYQKDGIALGLLSFNDNDG